MSKPRATFRETLLSYPYHFEKSILGDRPTNRLSDRVRRVIEERERQSEVAISWVQLVFACLLLVAISLLQKKFSGAPAVAVLALIFIYLFFTGFKIVVIRKRLLNDWLIHASVAIDIGAIVLITLIAHADDHDPSLRLAPAFAPLAVAGAIGLRALTLNPVWVLFSGAAAMFALLIPVGPATFGSHTAITGSDIDATVWRSIGITLLAEAEKIAAVLILTTIVALALERGRRLLIASVQEQAATAELSRFFAPDIAEEIVSSGDEIELGKGVQRSAAIMFIDLRSFTTLSNKLEPQSLIEMIISYQSCVVPIVTKHSGSIITYLGDGIMVAFGATKPSATFSADAMRAAEDLCDALPSWKSDRQARGLPSSDAGIGLASGRVTFGAIGHVGRLEYAVIGDPVSRSAKLQGETKRLGVFAVADRELWEEAGRQGFVPRASFSQDTCELPGLSGMVSVYALANAGIKR